MPVYFEYALKVSLCLAIVFLFYFLLLRQMTYYIWNRYFLLIFAILSFIVPFINVSLFVQSQLETLPFVGQIPVIASNKISLHLANSYKAVDYWQLFFYVYVLGSSILLVRLLVQLLSIKKIRSKATLTVADDVKIYHLPEPVLPFSFLNSIFINTNNYSENELQEIIDHERVHVQQKHTLDVLISEVICILNWYNPFAWLIKNAVRENLEFIADDAVIRKGVNPRNYQYLLLKVTGDIPSSITNNLKFSSLKNRFLMMNKTKTGSVHLLKFALLVPLVAILLLAFRNKHEINSNVTIEQTSTAKTYILSSLTYSIPDKKVEAVVKKEQGESLLKTGKALNLELVYNEKARLQNVLENNGFNDIGTHAITFIIDTTLGNNGFSVQVNINLAKDELSENKEEQHGKDATITSQVNTKWSLGSAKPIMQPDKTDVRKNIREDKLNNNQLIIDNKLSSIK